MLDKKKWNLTHIFNTHHHSDHTIANLELKNIFDCIVFGPLIELDKIPGINHGLICGEIITFGEHPVRIIATPGHTKGHICYHFLEDNIIFVGDTLFSIGCGKIYKNSYHEMFESLKKIKSLPEKTQIYFGHEYTYNNARFALSFDSNNLELQKYFARIEYLYNTKIYTNPTMLSIEKKTNPFLRTENLILRKNIQMEDASEIDFFTELRRRKDLFK
ncbi:Zn-dependent hydrolase [Candidatus Liberibacter americanus str. Sao Paulo]|uniref:Hydroxyacylglutathione hydrolase n=2 Tax=Candidatus Liberibacter americanus TaxID=309868 RepID=U6B6C6_9HYPH|nr:Zn-dependent hydrolase [Candidatus Liberibacter americanus str. Sao Paulo]